MKIRPYASICSISGYRNDRTGRWPVEKGTERRDAGPDRLASPAAGWRFGAVSLCGLLIWLLIRYDRM